MYKLQLMGDQLNISFGPAELSENVCARRVSTGCNYLVRGSTIHLHEYNPLV